MKKLKLLGISGSIRKRSYNTALLKALAEINPQNIELNITETLAEIPIFDPDLGAEDHTEALLKLRRQIDESHAVIICTPEYAHNISGVLKNTLDWLVSSEELILKPIVAMSVSTSALGGARAHASLLTTLNAMNTRVLSEASLTLPFAKSKFSQTGDLIDPLTKKTLSHALKVIENLIDQ